jgi:hypothetical protein
MAHGAEYLAIPKSSHASVEVATGTALKTLLQVATPSTTGMMICGWGWSMDGTSGSAAPGQVDLIDVDVAATVTSLTPEKRLSANAPASLCVGGASATGYNASAEGTITDSRLLDSPEIHPQTGYGVWFDSNDRIYMKPSRFLRIRCLFAATVNGVPWLAWYEL